MVKRGDQLSLGESASVVFDKHVASVTCNAQFQYSCTNETKLWPLLLGHLPFSHIFLVKNNVSVKHASNSFCQICLDARQTRLPFPHRTIKTTKPFEILHVDVWGPYKAVTRNGCTLFLTIAEATLA